MKNLILMGFLCFLVLGACQNKQEVVPSEERAKPLLNTTSVLLKADVVSDLADNGAVQVPKPATWTPVPELTGYTEVLLFEEPTGEAYEVYVWDNPDHLGDNQGVCTKAWDNGDCYGSSDQCDLELRDGKLIIICCDELA